MKSVGHGTVTLSQPCLLFFSPSLTWFLSGVLLPQKLSTTGLLTVLQSLIPVHLSLLLFLLLGYNTLKARRRTALFWHMVRVQLIMTGSRGSSHVHPQLDAENDGCAHSANFLVLGSLGPKLRDGCCCSSLPIAINLLRTIPQNRVWRLSR